MSLNEGLCIGGILCEIHCYLVVSVVSDSHERGLTVDCGRNDSIVPIACQLGMFLSPPQRRPDSTMLPVWDFVFPQSPRLGLYCVG